MPDARDTIAFTSDYGLRDPFVGVCHGVIARIAPHARVLDLSHGLPRHDVITGAAVLADCLPYLPPAIHLAVVDPGVGTARRAVAVAAGDAADPTLLVGPDNGLLVPAAERAGGIRGAWELSDPRFRLDSVAVTFHGRDVFAPAAAHLARGVDPAELGPPLPAEALVRLPELAAAVRPGVLEGAVVAVDTFGNVALSLRGEDLAAAQLHVGDRVVVSAFAARWPATVVRTFDEVDERALGVLVDSFGRVAIVVKGGDAAARLGLVAGDHHEITIRASGSQG